MTTVAPAHETERFRAPERAVSPGRPTWRGASRIIPALVVAAAALLAGALLWSRADYVPMWDGRIYAECFIDAATRPLRLEAYRCANHVSHAYAAIVAMAQRVAPRSPVPMLAANAALFALAAAALWRILGRLFPERSHATGRALVTAAFLLHPIVLAALVQPGLDFGVLVFTLCALAAAVDGRPGGLAVAGSLLVFSKEPGLLVYAVVATFYAARAVLPTTVARPVARAAVIGGAAFLVAYNLAPWHPAILPGAAVVGLGALVLARPTVSIRRAEAFELARRAARLWPLAIPVLLFAAYAGYRLATHAPAATNPSSGGGGAGSASGVVFWGGDNARMLAHMFLRLDPHPFVRSAFALIFVVGFLWVPTALVAADAAIGAARAATGRPRRPLVGAREDLVAFVLAITAALAWILTRYVTYSNARYYLPVYPLLLLAAFCALVRLGVPRLARNAVLAAVVALLAVSTTRTVDPLSRRLWGTFRFGEHAVLRVTALTGECCGYGRDQLAYNLQFTALAHVQDELYARLRPSDKTVFVARDDASWFTVGPIDARTGRRTLRQDGTILPPVVPATVLLRSSARIADGWTAWFLAFPNVDNAAVLAALRERFDVGPAEWGRTPDGYAMAAYQLRDRLRASGSASPR